MVKLLRWNDVLRTSRTFCSKNCNIFSVLCIFKYNPGKTDDKFITFQSFPSSDIIPTSSKEKENDELLYTVTRYGPQLVASASG